MNKVLIVHTSWYENYISQMTKISSEILNNDFKCSIAKAPGAIELAALAKNKLNKNELNNFCGRRHRGGGRTN